MGGGTGGEERVRTHNPEGSVQDKRENKRQSPFTEREHKNRKICGNNFFRGF